MMNVQNNKFKLLLAAGAVSMALTGCGGSDGSDGNPGNPGGPAADAIEVLHLDVTKVKYFTLMSPRLNTTTAHPQSQSLRPTRKIFLLSV